MAGLPPALLAKWATPFDHAAAKLRSFCECTGRHRKSKICRGLANIDLERRWCNDITAASVSADAVGEVFMISTCDKSSCCWQAAWPVA